MTETIHQKNACLVDLSLVTFSQDFGGSRIVQGTARYRGRNYMIVGDGVPDCGMSGMDRLQVATPRGRLAGMNATHAIRLAVAERLRVQ
ncbi:MAG: hypothetical protein B7733_05850 [Myxococcales bacterium FL481]|nr:MAG: hypothetical protein B7733_05850 [Myxococcales bacterium FL481]